VSRTVRVDNPTGVGVRSNGIERWFISTEIEGVTQMAETTVKGFFEGLSDKLNAKPEKVAGMNCVYQFRVTDAAWNVKLADGKVAVAEGEAPSPNCTITMAEADFLDLVSGKMNGQMAFLTGKLKVAGDMGLALKLGSFIG
jgi:putative sterol carrier protein